LRQFEQLLERYGYLSEVGTDIAVPTWKEDPQLVRELFVQFLAADGSLGENEPLQMPRHRGKKNRGLVQRRVDLKGRVTEVYSQLLAQLRWGFVALEQEELQAQLLSHSGDIFFLEFEEVRRVVAGSDSELINHLRQLVEIRRSQLEQDRQLEAVPHLVYGNAPPSPHTHLNASSFNGENPRNGLASPHTSHLQGIGASPGQVEGTVKVLRSWQLLPEIDRETILVVPYTDSGWAPLLARAGGLIAEVGGRLSHGAIVAREYSIPAVMDIHNATYLLQDGQRVRIDGHRGTVEIL
jgi:pyruvate,water dikinase